MTTLTRGAATVSPDLVLGWDIEQQSRTIIHDVIGRGFPDVTAQPAGSREGTLDLFFESAAAAEAARVILAAPGPLLLNAPEVGSAFTLVVTGGLRVSLDMRGGKRWTIAVPFREVEA